MDPQDRHASRRPCGRGGPRSSGAGRAGAARTNRQPDWPGSSSGSFGAHRWNRSRRSKPSGRSCLIGAVEVSDDRVSSSIDGTPGPSFRQIELEVKGSGAGRLLRDLSDRLIRAGAKPTSASKLETALGGQPEPEVEVPRLRPRSRLDTLVGYALARSVIRLIDEDPKIRASSDADPVHDARVATRRLRSDLKTLEPYLSPVEGLRTELGWLGGLLGEVRDLDVLIERMRARIAGLPEPDQAAGGRDPREARRRSSSAARRAPRWARLRQVPRARGRTDRGQLADPPWLIMPTIAVPGRCFVG